MRALRKLRELSWADRGLLLEASLWLGVARLALLTIPFRWIAPYLGQQKAESGPEIGPFPEDAVLRIGWAVRSVARRTPWESACLAQAIAADRMLQRRGIPGTLYLGMAKGETDEWQAHAWLRCGPHILTGQQGHERFVVVSTFANL
ncbi:MAG: lasso peptide biosynthesis B2 protein [Chloroflexi bacterium]|nr:lasso peptide biosynthesis B2 protein [Chloroflexota bacterium]